MPDSTPIQHIESLGVRVDGVESLLRSAIKEWAEERKQILEVVKDGREQTNNAIKELSQQTNSSIEKLADSVSRHQRPNTAVLVGIGAILITVISTGAALVWFVQNLSISPLNASLDRHEARLVKIEDRNQETLSQIAEQTVIQRLLLEGRLRIDTTPE